MNLSAYFIAFILVFVGRILNEWMPFHGSKYYGIFPNSYFLARSTKKWAEMYKKNIIGIALKNALPYFRIEKEGLSHSIFLNLQISAKIQTGDADFDSKYFIISEDLSLGTTFKNNKNLRLAVEQLFEKYKCKRLYCENGRLWIEGLPLDKDSLENNSIAESLHIIEDAFKTTTPDRRKSRKYIALTICGFNLALLSTAFTSYFITRDGRRILDDEIYDHTIILGVILASLWFLLVATIIRKTTWARYTLVHTLFIGTVGWLCAAFVLLYAINHQADSMPVQNYHTSVIYKQKGARGSCSLVVDSWDPSDSISIEKRGYNLVDCRKLYKKAQIGMPVTIEVRTGYLGYRWVSREILQ